MAAIAAATIGSILGFGLPLLKKVTGTLIDADIRSITLHMSFLYATFQDYSELSIDPDKATKEWLKRINNLAYDMEDFIDQFLSRQSSNPLSTAWRIVAIPFQLSRQIGKFRKISAEAKDYFELYKVKHTSTPTTTKKATDEVHPHVSKEKSLLQLVTNAPRGSQTKPKVISIIGYSALGNSLVVDKVYNNNNEVCDLFPLHARVNARHKDVEQVLRDIYDHLSKNQHGAIGTSSAVEATGVIQPEEADTSSAVDVKGNGIMGSEEAGGTSNTVDATGNGVILPLRLRFRLCQILQLLSKIFEILLCKLPDLISGNPQWKSVSGSFQRSGGTSNTVNATGNGIIQPVEASGTSNRVDATGNGGDIDSMEAGGTLNTFDATGNSFIQTADTGVPLSKQIESCLKGVRFLIVIDNVNMENLDCIIKHLGDKVDGVIIATTDYTEAAHCKCPSFGLDCSTRPQYLMVQELTGKGYEQETEQQKKALQDLLVSKYNKSLSSLNLEQCLLYFCMFPYGRLVRWNLLKMRYLAEGIAFEIQENQHQGGHFSPLKYLGDFVDQHGVQPVQVRKNGQVKKCQLPVMLLNHIFVESKSKRFLTLLCGSTYIRGLDANEKEYVRRLSLHPPQNDTMTLPNSRDLPRLRTLVVFHPDIKGKVGNISELSKYKLLRVLDLKECAFFGTENLKKICGLLLLRCLSLGDSIVQVPRDIAKLKLLQTLDMTKAKTVYVPVEVMELPELQHLIGKFQLFHDDITNKKLEELLKTKSKLERLSGFVISNSEEFQQLMSRMENLNKVKIWYEAENWAADVSDAIKNFIAKDRSLSSDTENKGSLSIECRKCPKDFVESLMYCALTSLKLCGDLRSFLDFEGPRLAGIQELCLSGTNLIEDEIVCVVNLFKSLKYLKLVEKNLGPLSIPADCLYSLTRLCLVATGTLSEITIPDGALRCLVSLHMLFRKQKSLEGIQITKEIKEIALHSEVDQDIKEYWQAQASKQDMPPNVLLIQSPEIEKKAPAVQSIVS